MRAPNEVGRHAGSRIATGATARGLNRPGRVARRAGSGSAPECLVVPEMPQTSSTRRPRCLRPDHLGLGGPRGHWDAPMSISACGKKKGAPKAPPHRSVPRTATTFPGRFVARSCINHLYRSTGEGRVGQIRSRCALAVSGARPSIVCRWRMDPAGNLVKDPVGNHSPCESAEYWAPPSCKETRCEDRGNRGH